VATEPVPACEQRRWGGWVFASKGGLLWASDEDLAGGDDQLLAKHGVFGGELPPSTHEVTHQLIDQRQRPGESPERSLRPQRFVGSKSAKPITDRRNHGHHVA